MKVRINYTLPDGSDDSIIITGDDIEETREIAQREVELRHATNPWSEVLEE